MMDPRYLQQAVTGMVWIEDGEAGANRYPVTPGNSVPLFDKNEQRFFIKTVDISGMPQPLREFKYEEVIKTPQPEVSTADFVTKQELDEFQTAITTKMDEIMQKYLSNQNQNNNRNNKNNKGE